MHVPLKAPSWSVTDMEPMNMFPLQLKTGKYFDMGVAGKIVEYSRPSFGKRINKNRYPSVRKIKSHKCCF